MSLSPRSASSSSKLIVGGNNNNIYNNNLNHSDPVHLSSSWTPTNARSRPTTPSPSNSNSRTGSRIPTPRGRQTTTATMGPMRMVSPMPSLQQTGAASVVARRDDTNRRNRPTPLSQNISATANRARASARAVRSFPEPASSYDEPLPANSLVLLNDNFNNDDHASDNVVSNIAVGEWVEMLSDGTGSVFHRQSWKRRFVVADAFGLMFFKDQGAHTRNEHHKAESTRLYHTMKFFIPAFMSEPGHHGVTTLVDDKTGMNIFHPHACEESKYYYFGFIPKQPPGAVPGGMVDLSSSSNAAATSSASSFANPVLLMRTRSFVTRDKFVHFIARCFTPSAFLQSGVRIDNQEREQEKEQEQPTLNVDRATQTTTTVATPAKEDPQQQKLATVQTTGRVASLPLATASNHQIHSLTTSATSVVFSSSGWHPERCCKDADAQTIGYDAVPAPPPPALEDVVAALTDARTQLDASNALAEEQRSKIWGLEQQVVALQAKQDLKGIDVDTARLSGVASVLFHKNNIDAATLTTTSSGGISNAPCIQPPASDSASIASSSGGCHGTQRDHIITNLRRQVAQLTLQKESLSITLSRLQTKFETCLRAFCERVLCDLELMRSESHEMVHMTSERWRAKFDKMRHDHILELESLASASNCGAGTSPSHSSIAHSSENDDFFTFHLRQHASLPFNPVLSANRSMSEVVDVRDKQDGENGDSDGEEEDEEGNNALDRTWTLRLFGGLDATTFLRIVIVP
eukprot:PhM_4_TR18493/c0_g1_i2/m.11539